MEQTLAFPHSYRPILTVERRIQSEEEITTSFSRPACTGTAVATNTWCADNALCIEALVHPSIQTSFLFVE